MEINVLNEKLMMNIIGLFQGFNERKVGFQVESENNDDQNNSDEQEPIDKSEPIKLHRR